MAFDPAAKTLTLTRTAWLTGRPETKTCPLDQLNRLELWSDRSSLEVFINGGSLCSPPGLTPPARRWALDVRGADGCGITLRPIHCI